MCTQNLKLMPCMSFNPNFYIYFKMWAGNTHFNQEFESPDVIYLANI